jgi:hypothetical protein
MQATAMSVVDLEQSGGGLVEIGEPGPGTGQHGVPAFAERLAGSVEQLAR